jgi:hypothetical protein
LKIGITILLFIGIGLQNFNRFIIVANYEINKAYITNNFCENKNKPKMACNGKCHLKKQLDKEQQKENNPINSVNEKLEIQFFAPLTAGIKFQRYSIGKFQFIPYELKPVSTPAFPIFHPPQVITC